jgi:hypothetical protein
MTTSTSRVVPLEVSMRNPSRSVRSAAPVAAPASSSTDPKRRRFLLTLGLGGAGAAAAAVAAVPAAAAGALTAAPVAPEGGYRESAHVRDYYRTAKL